METIDLTHVLKIENETTWSDLLAVLMHNDPATTAAWLDIDSGSALTVEREVVGVDGRPDIKVHDQEGNVRAVVEVKLLAGLGAQQLERYRRQVDEGEQSGVTLVLVSPAALPLAISLEGWRETTWEDVLALFTKSSDPWVQTTAASMKASLASRMPQVNGNTKWKNLETGQYFAVQLRARVSWLYQQLHVEKKSQLDLAPSSSGPGWILTYEIPVNNSPEYSVYLEVEEQLPRKNGWPKFAGPHEQQPRGPLMFLALRLESATSHCFNWKLLRTMWELVPENERLSVLTTSAKPRDHIDKQHWRAEVDSGMPKYVGKGFGNGQVQKFGWCAFGIYLRVDDQDLSGIAAQIQNIVCLMHRMSGITQEELAGVLRPTGQPS